MATLNPWLALLPPDQQLLAQVDPMLMQDPPAAAPMEAFAPPAAQPMVPRGTSVDQRTEVRQKASGQGVMPGEDYKALVDRLNQRELESLKQQGLSIDDMKQRLAKVQGEELPLDLTPLAALVDTWTGSKLAQSYRPPETKKERQASVDRLQQQILQAQQGLSENEIAMLRSQLNNQFQMENLDYRREQDKRQAEFDRQKMQLARDAMANKGQIKPEDAFNMRVKLTNLEPAKQARGINNFLEALNEYESLVDKYGINPVGEGSTELNSAYAKMSTSFKEAENLGALAGPDLDILRQNVANAGDFGTWVKAQAKGGTPGLKAAIGQARKGASNNFNLSMQNLKGISSGVEDITNPVIQDYERAHQRAMTPPSSELERLLKEKAARAKAKK